MSAKLHIVIVFLFAGPKSSKAKLLIPGLNILKHIKELLFSWPNTIVPIKDTKGLMDYTRSTFERCYIRTNQHTFTIQSIKWHKLHLTRKILQWFTSKTRIWLQFIVLQTLQLFIMHELNILFRTDGQNTRKTGAFTHTGIINWKKKVELRRNTLSFDLLTVARWINLSFTIVHP